jgi:hypothetical protein
MVVELLIVEQATALQIVEQSPGALRLVSDNSIVGTSTAALIVASEALAAGDLVNIWNNASAFNVRKASASLPGKEAHGFVLTDVAALGTATVHFEGTNTRITGLTPGVQFLSDATPGKTSGSPASGTGKVVQIVGFAVGPAAMNFQYELPIVLA